MRRGCTPSLCLCNLRREILIARQTGRVSYEVRRGRQRGEGEGFTPTDGWVMCSWVRTPQETSLCVCVIPLTFSHLSVFRQPFIHSLSHIVTENSEQCCTSFSAHKPNSSSLPYPHFLSLSLSSLLFSLMDGANAHHQQRPSGGDSFLHLLTEGENRAAEIIHSFTHTSMNSLNYPPAICWLFWICTWSIHFIHLWFSPTNAFASVIQSDYMKPNKLMSLLHSVTVSWIQP